MSFSGKNDGYIHPQNEIFWNPQTEVFLGVIYVTHKYSALVTLLI